MLQIRNLRASYHGAILALRSVSIEVPDGAVVAVLGARGAGKTTLLRAISGTLSAHGGAVDSGSIELDGRWLAGRSAAAIATVGVVHVPEGGRLLSRLAVAESLPRSRRLLNRPRMLLIDEPYLGLEPGTAGRAQEVIKRINALGTTVLLVERDGAIALPVADRAYVLTSGLVTWCGDSAGCPEPGAEPAADVIV